MKRTRKGAGSTPVLIAHASDQPGHSGKLRDRQKPEITAIEPLRVMRADIDHAGRHDAAPLHMLELHPVAGEGEGRSQPVTVAEIACVHRDPGHARRHLDLGEAIARHAEGKPEAYNAGYADCYDYENKGGI